MSSKPTTKAAWKRCPRKCIDCEGEDHHWGVYGGDRLSCKHCPAAVNYGEQCARCECKQFQLPKAAP